LQCWMCEVLDAVDRQNTVLVMRRNSRGIPVNFHRTYKLSILRLLLSYFVRWMRQDLSQPQYLRQIRDQDIWKQTQDMLTRCWLFQKQSWHNRSTFSCELYFMRAVASAVSGETNVVDPLLCAQYPEDLNLYKRSCRTPYPLQATVSTPEKRRAYSRPCGSGPLQVTVGAPPRIGKHFLVGRTSITNAVQTPHLGNLESSSINYFIIITMPSNAYIARERRFTKTINILKNNKYSNISVCARAKSISRRILFNQ